VIQLYPEGSGFIHEKFKNYANIASRKCEPQAKDFGNNKQPHASGLLRKGFD
jgi:hypothetical protein